MEGSSFQFALYGEGYSEGQDPSQGKPNSKIRTLVQGPGNWVIIISSKQETNTSLLGESPVLGPFSQNSLFQMQTVSHFQNIDVE